MIELTCKTCGASLELDLTVPKVICKYCHNEYLVEQLLTERRIDNMDMINQLKPVAENAYNLCNYAESGKLYEKLLMYDASPINIARYNISLLGCNLIQPTDNLFETLTVLEPKDKYKHIMDIYYKTYSAAKQQYKIAIRNYNGLNRIKILYSTYKWYRPYKSMIDRVKELRCSCGRIIQRGKDECNCGVTRQEILNYEKSRRNTFRFMLLLIVCLCVVVTIKYFMG